MIKKETKRVVVTVEIEIDEDGVDEIVDSFDGDILEFLNWGNSGEYTLSPEVKKILKIEEFEE